MAQLTQAMCNALRRAPRDWARFPPYIEASPRVIKALAARGLVEIKHVAWLGEHTEMWRRMRKA
ncbi:CoA ester lyase [Ralstonia phage RPZH3]|nr:CoA ester lyase [Ralstonia phage RPZH3]